MRKVFDCTVLFNFFPNGSFACWLLRLAIAPSTLIVLVTCLFLSFYAIVMHDLFQPPFNCKRKFLTNFVTLVSSQYSSVYNEFSAGLVFTEFIPSIFSWWSGLLIPECLSPALGHLASPNRRMSYNFPTTFWHLCHHTCKTHWMPIEYRWHIAN